MRSFRTIGAYHNIPILVRGALNVPLVEGSVANTYRLRRAAPTLKYLSDQGARVVLISHLGERGTETLEPVTAALGKLLPRVRFFPESIGPKAREAVRAMLPGEILVLENLRRHPGEVGNDPAFAHELAALADVFVQDSFDTCHRAHASMVGVPQLLPSYAGQLVEEEIEALSHARKPTAPSLAIIGGAKFETKESLLTALLPAYDHLFVGGALANDFLKAKGYPVGKSLVSPTTPRGIAELLANPKLLLPIDVLVVPNGTLDRTSARTVKVEEVTENDTILDHGPHTSALLQTLAHDAKTILWNGPVGMYENGFVDGTDAVAQIIAQSGAHSIVGGGDTIASIEKLGLFSKFSFVSTGGGAMLDYLADGVLPGITALG